MRTHSISTDRLVVFLSHSNTAVILSLVLIRKLKELQISTIVTMGSLVSGMINYNCLHK